MSLHLAYARQEARRTIPGADPTRRQATGGVVDAAVICQISPPGGAFRPQHN